MARYWDDKQTLLGFGIQFKTNIGNCSAKPMLGNEIGNCINTDVKTQLWYSIIFSCDYGWCYNIYGSCSECTVNSGMDNWNGEILEGIICGHIWGFLMNKHCNYFWTSVGIENTKSFFWHPSKPQCMWKPGSHALFSHIFKPAVCP